ncbi:hypothetical protein RFI_14712 [Reticulomyxa filosa]|uniref:RING-type domain-containing protein n=1 Tax=Reticulomyxa filosa TaxID=46433 RepID=X6NAZ8_RETFI|nr:hypothetical protein RFI_14712 [Reticulomyxa filosa]|eukprot:ETO22487.1 hypothetical protein RFI_14712 [Reticulomyxa filosa]
MSHVSLDHFQLSTNRLALALPQKSKKSSKKRQVSNDPKKNGQSSRSSSKKESKKGYDSIKKQKKRHELSYQKKALSSKVCAVCLDKKSLDLMLLPCAHVFHGECISK